MTGKTKMFLLNSRKTYMIARIGLGLVFISSGIIKVFDLESFSKVIEAFGILPPELCYPLAMMLSPGEIIVGTCLAADIKGSLSAVFLMLLTFAAVLSYAIHMGYDIDCGCFGPDDPETKVFPGLRGSLLRDLFMIALSLYLYLWRFKNRHRPFSPYLFINRR